jgi:hypothetical protein
VGGAAPFGQFVHDGEVVAARAFVFGQQGRVEVDRTQARDGQEFVAQFAPVEYGQAQVVFQTTFFHCFQGGVESVERQAQFFGGGSRR